MKSATIEELIDSIEKYNPMIIPDVLKAYQYAKKLHSGQKRESGEEYITHPLTVAYTLSLMKADKNTLCAALLHDTIEDTEIEKEDIARDFNPEVAELVDGVTKINNINISTEKDNNKCY